MNENGAGGVASSKNLRPWERSKSGDRFGVYPHLHTPWQCRI